MKEPRWLDQRALLFLHSASITEFGGKEGLRDAALLESALARPRNKFSYAQKTTIFALAAAYGFGLARNHPFYDGNKRIALMAIGLFLEMNGYHLAAEETDACQIIFALAGGQLTEMKLAHWIERNARRIP